MGTGRDGTGRGEGAETEKSSVMRAVQYCTCYRNLDQMAGFDWPVAADL